MAAQTQTQAQTRKVKAEIDGDEEETAARFVKPHIPDNEARERWPLRYQGKKKKVAGAKKLEGRLCGCSPGSASLFSG